MARRKGGRFAVQRAFEIGIGMTLLGGLISYNLLDFRYQDSVLTAAAVGSASAVFWLLRFAARWSWRKRERIRKQWKVWWRWRTTGLITGAITGGIATGIALYASRGSIAHSLRVGLTIALSIFGLWLVRPLLRWLGSMIVASWKWFQTRREERAPLLSRGRKPVRSSRVITQHEMKRLSPEAFEELCATIARGWGYKARAVGESGDGGIDVEMWREGEYVVGQCKRYKGTVPISHVRDFYGAMMHVGASRGYLFSTGRFSSGAYEFVQDKPIELIDGEYLENILQRLDRRSAVGHEP